jgi:hypothetical protein
VGSSDGTDDDCRHRYEYGEPDNGDGGSDPNGSGINEEDDQSSSHEGNDAQPACALVTGRCSRPAPVRLWHGLNLLRAPMAGLLEVAEVGLRPT